MRIDHKASPLLAQFVAADMIRAGHGFTVQFIGDEINFRYDTKNTAAGTVLKNSIKRQIGWVNGEGR